MTPTTPHEECTIAAPGAEPRPFGYVGVSMLRRGPPGTSQTFMGTFDELHNTVPVYRGDALYVLRSQRNALRAELSDAQATIDRLKAERDAAREALRAALEQKE